VQCEIHNACQAYFYGMIIAEDSALCRLIAEGNRMEHRISLAEKVKTHDLAMFITYAVAVLISGISPTSHTTWFFVMLPTLLLVSLLSITYKTFRFSASTYTLILIQSLIVLLGAHYQYNRIPFARITLMDGTSRSIIDWVAHFFVSFPVTFIMIDLLKAYSGITLKWLFRVILLASCLGLAVTWELVEWDTYIDLSSTFVSSILLLIFIKLPKGDIQIRNIDMILKK
jgi:putative membrane protein